MTNNKAQARYLNPKASRKVVIIREKILERFRRHFALSEEIDLITVDVVSLGEMFETQIKNSRLFKDVGEDHGIVLFFIDDTYIEFSFFEHFVKKTFSNRYISEDGWDIQRISSWNAKEPQDDFALIFTFMAIETVYCVAIPLREVFGRYYSKVS